MTENKSNTIIAIFGPSGCGKTRHKETLISMGWKEIKSTVTRAKRGESDDEYNFKSEEEWQNLVDEDELVNVNHYAGHNYGTHVDDFKAARKAVMLTDITNINGSRGSDDLRYVAEREGKNLILVYCSPPDKNEMIRRQQQRGTPERIKKAVEEIGKMNFEVDQNVPDAFWVFSDGDVIELGRSIE